MDKRFIVFIVSSVAILGIYALVDAFVLPKPKPPAVPPAAEGVAKLDRDEVPADKAADEPATEDPEGADDVADPDPADAVKPADAGDDVEAAAAPTQIAQTFVTLGSVDPKSGDPFLATFDNAGAAVERVELSDPKYRELEEDLAYLGHLALKNDPAGVLVRTVGPGTPAAAAGILVDDVIVKWNDLAVRTIDEWNESLADARPGDKVSLTIQRQGAAAPVVVTVTLMRTPMQMVRPEFNDETKSFDPPSYLLHLANGKDIKDRKALVRAAESMRRRRWEVVPRPAGETGPVRSVSFRLALNEEEREDLGIKQPIAVVKTYALPKPSAPPAGAETQAPVANHHLEMTVRVETEGETATNLAFILQGPTGAPSEGWWYATKIHPTDMFTSLGARDLAYSTVSAGHLFFGAPAIFANSVDPARRVDNVMFTGVTAPTEPIGQLNYAVIDSQYFVAGLVPMPPEDAVAPMETPFYELRAMTAGTAVNVISARKKLLNTSFELTSQPFEVTAEKPFERSYRLFFGPKDPEVLAPYGLQDCISYGWFGLVSRPLLVVLHFFESFTRNYALAIIMLTICVRALMFPLGRRAAMNARKMQELGPEMKALREKYKDDFEKLGKAQRELFRRHNYNPFSGCWMIFIQIPIFLGLYRGLSTDIALRGASLIPGLSWASNLAAPDKLLYWGTWPEWAFGYTGWLGPYLNVLPLITVALFLVQQKLLMPPATDEQTRLQQKMMSYMTLFIGVMFFRVPSGLCVYFITSSLWGITERKLLPKSKPPLPEAGGGDAGTASPIAKPAPSGDRRSDAKSGLRAQGSARGKSKSRK